jgi:hypothetical protein
MKFNLASFRRNHGKVEYLEKLEESFHNNSWHIAAKISQAGMGCDPSVVPGCSKSYSFPGNKSILTCPKMIDSENRSEGYVFI